MTDLIWYKHAETGAEVLQAESARAILAGGGWFPMSPEDVEALNQAFADEEAATEAAMRADAERGRPGGELPDREAATEAAMRADAESARTSVGADEPETPQVTEETAQAQIEAARKAPEDESNSTEENA